MRRAENEQRIRPVSDGSWGVMALGAGRSPRKQRIPSILYIPSKEAVWKDRGVRRAVGDFLVGWQVGEGCLAPKWAASDDKDRRPVNRGFPWTPCNVTTFCALSNSGAHPEWHLEHQPASAVTPPATELVVPSATGMYRHVWWCACGVERACWRLFLLHPVRVSGGWL